MKRYFLVQDADMPAGAANLGEWHGIDLGSHRDDAAGWHAVVLVDDHIEAPTTWHPLPPALDARTTTKHATPHHVHLKATGLTGDETTLETAVRLAKIHPLFGI